MFHQTSVSLVPNAFQPLQKRASPSSFWFSEVDLNLFNQKKTEPRDTNSYIGSSLQPFCKYFVGFIDTF